MSRSIAPGRPVRVGLVGCGNVSGQYLLNLDAPAVLDVVACADAQPARADATARAFGIPRAVAVDQLLADDDIDLVLNLTNPAGHAEVSLAAIAAGKHVYTEKPLAGSLAEADEVLAAAAARGLRVGCAPDTFLGPGLRRCAELIADGAIGVPVSANAFMMTAGPEAFHPAPEFLYQPGAGPLMDGGPYGVSALVALLGPVASVSGASTRGRDTRSVLTGARAGSRFPVDVPTHVAALLRFARGAVATLVTSFDVHGTRTPRLEVHGTTGSLICPAPNAWGGPAFLRSAGAEGFDEVHIDGGEGNRIGMGLLEMGSALQQGRAPRASGDLGRHVLEVLEGIRTSDERGGGAVDIRHGYELVAEGGSRA
ncbi:Gfo/Idh/MocA family oxidoreductase [Microbacterium saccharophilum]|uniref:Gfo/Idh/MocA family oxidoreductase n=1 Tax=Microbacterium saccharophilum TaxID=1213358 RepID=A0A5C8HW70_9MICO|nr:Gfo/Idh/MocA family oxidoreductase [Microbacterium saccharophilum]TXK09189.1 Gfo/Idh/MocA family oxidoreductase [Microbacterium saccharophilum]GEP47629.1 oxidoreductase [Microbacterium saccharophilum]